MLKTKIIEIPMICVGLTGKKIVVSIVKAKRFRVVLLVAIIVHSLQFEINIC